MTLYPYDPDYVVPTSQVLRDWMDLNNLSASTAAVIASKGRGHESHQAATQMLNDVLNGKRVTPKVAGLLAIVTGIPMSFWLAFERNYRTGLAAGKSVS